MLASGFIDQFSANSLLFIKSFNINRLRIDPEAFPDPMPRQARHFDVLTI